MSRKELKIRKFLDNYTGLAIHVDITHYENYGGKPDYYHGDVSIYAQNETVSLYLENSKEEYPECAARLDNLIKELQKVKKFLRDTRNDDVHINP